MDGGDTKKMADVGSSSIAGLASRFSAAIAAADAVVVAAQARAAKLRSAAFREAEREMGRIAGLASGRLTEADVESANMADVGDVTLVTDQKSFVEGRFTQGYRHFSYFWSTALLIFALVVTYWDIAKGWTNDFDNDPNHSTDTMVALNIILFTGLLFWVALLEGAQSSIVGLSSVHIESFKDTHPQAYAVCQVCHTGANLERFIVGRQTILLFVVFVISRLGSHSQLTSSDGNHQDFYMGDWTWARTGDLVLLQNSVLLTIVITVPGSLVSQLVATDKMLAFLEMGYAPLYTVVMPSLLMESLGLTHLAYGLGDIMSSLTSENMGSIHGNKNRIYYIKLLISTGLVGFGLVCVVYGLLTKQTNATTGPGWERLPGWAALVLTLFFGFFIGCCEGFQIAAFKLKKFDLSDEFHHSHPAAYRTERLLLRGRNLRAFMIGRQVIVLMMMVLLGRVTSFSRDCSEDTDNANVTDISDTSDSDCIFGFPDWFMQGFLQSGIVGAIVVVNLFQLSFRMAAACFPVHFIDHNIMYVLLRIALIVEASGVVNACWPLAWYIEWVFDLKDCPDMPTLQEAEVAAALIQENLDKINLELEELAHKNPEIAKIVHHIQHELEEIDDYDATVHPEEHIVHDHVHRATEHTTVFDLSHAPIQHEIGHNGVRGKRGRRSSDLSQLAGEIGGQRRSSEPSRLVGEIGGQRRSSNLSRLAGEIGGRSGDPQSKMQNFGGDGADSDTSDEGTVVQQLTERGAKPAGLESAKDKKFQELLQAQEAAHKKLPEDQQRIARLQTTDPQETMTSEV